MKKFDLIEFPYIQDKKGETIPFELDERFPFPVKRVYVITAAEGQIRGGHAHQAEDEVFVVLHGEVEALVHDGEVEKTLILNHKNQGLLVRHDCWHEFAKFSPEAVMLCFSSTHYESGKDQYITDRSLFFPKK
jgi:dTDP-4-dehydrorhamnose 3,5-epimerase-like enzyme